VTTIGDALEALVNEDENAPVEFTNPAGTITVHAKSVGPWGDDISLAAL
jgi:phage tail sheath gpL-like